MNAARALLERLSLTRQAALTGLAATGLVALGCAWWQHDVSRTEAAGAAATWWPLAAAAATGVAATAAAAWAASRAQRAHASVTTAARGIAREPALGAGDETTLPLHTESADLLEATAALRRAEESLRQRIDSLVAQNDALTAQLSHRTLELSSLQDLAIGLAQRGGDMAGLVDEALRALEQTMAYASASVWARTDLDPAQPVMLLGYRSSATELSGLALSDLVGLRLSRANLQRYEQIERDGQAIVENRPQQSLFAWLWAMVTDDARTSALYRSTRSWMAVPLAVRERVLGVLRVDHAEPEHFDAERARLLGAVASQTALALRHAHLAERERDNAVAAERNRIARDLHDAVSQTLFAANLVAGALNKEAALPPAAQAQVQTLQRLNQGALAEMRMLMFELRPDALATLPLAELLQQAVAALAARGEIEVHAAIDPVDPPRGTRIELYRIAQEALSNVARHSGAHHVHLDWRASVGGPGRLTVRDDGHGFDAAGGAPPGHFGLANMRERAALMGAELQVHGAPGEGTTVEVNVNWSS